MNHTEFDVIRFENRNGITSWRVAGWLHGVRIRKNFKTREDAAAEKATFEIKAIQAASGLRSVATSLSDGDVREAEALFRRIAGKPHPLSFYVDYALAHYQEKQEKQKLLDEAVADYVSAKTHEFEQDQISRPQLKRIQWELKRLQAHFPGQSTSAITANHRNTVRYLYRIYKGVLDTTEEHAWRDLEKPMQSIGTSHKGVPLIIDFGEKLTKPTFDCWIKRAFHKRNVFRLTECIRPALSVGFVGSSIWLMATSIFGRDTGANALIPP